MPISPLPPAESHGGLLNGGQVCLCADYVFVPAHRCDEFVVAAQRQFRTSFPTVVGNPDYTSIVDDKNYRRVPRVRTSSKRDRRARVMTEEVFGPVLAVLPYDDLDGVIDYINAGPSPLAAYWMGKDSDDFRR
jgi:coniferyl-aldehyde dehydrogenase